MKVRTEPSQPTPQATRAARVAAGRLRRLARAVAVGAGAAAALLAIAVLVRQGWEPMIRLDEKAVLAGTQFALARPALVDVLVAWQWAFEAKRLVVLVVATALVYRWRTGDASRAWWSIGTVLAAWGLSNVAKELVQRARPVLDEPLSHAAGYSFPSGHATNTAAMLTALVVLLWPVLRSRGARIAAVSGAALLVVLTAVDRVLLGAHYPSDVVAGILFGAGFVLASYLGYLGWSPRHPHLDRREDTA